MVVWYGYVVFVCVFVVFVGCWLLLVDELCVLVTCCCWVDCCYVGVVSCVCCCVLVCIVHVSVVVGWYVVVVWLFGCWLCMFVL